METNTCIQLNNPINNPTKTLPKIGDDSINVDIIGMVKAHLQSNTNNHTHQEEEGIPIWRHLERGNISKKHGLKASCLPFFYR